MKYNEKNYLEDISIKPLLENNQATTINSEECKRFNDYICAYYPWIAVSKSRIDWKQISNVKKIKWGYDSTENEVIKFLDNSFLSKYEEICFVYSVSSPGFIINYVTMTKHFFELIGLGFS